MAADQKYFKVCGVEIERLCRPISHSEQSICDTFGQCLNFGRKSIFLGLWQTENATCAPQQVYKVLDAGQRDIFR